MHVYSPTVLSSMSFAVSQFNSHDKDIFDLNSSPCAKVAVTGKNMY